MTTNSIILVFICLLSAITGKTYNGKCDTDEDCEAGDICIVPGRNTAANDRSQNKCYPCLCTYPSQCYVDNNEIKCNCSGFGTTGNLCQFDINECDPDPCKNGATCINSVNMYVCLCPEGYGGTNCTNELHTCGDTTCFNGGTCECSCLCPTGFYGDECSLSASLSALQCEGGQLQISCGVGETINIISANYGRTADVSVCPHSSIQTTDCVSANSYAIVSAACDGQQTCQVAASNSVFGDPCVYTYKYLEVEYYCG